MFDLFLFGELELFLILFLPFGFLIKSLETHLFEGISIKKLLLTVRNIINQSKWTITSYSKGVKLMRNMNMKGRVIFMTQFANYIFSRQMFKSQPRGEWEDDLEEIPNQFQMTSTGTRSAYDTDTLQQYSTISKNLQYGVGSFAKRIPAANFWNKNIEFLASKQRKINQLKSQQEVRALADCTFQPHVNKSRSKSARNIKQFLDSQHKHQEKIQDKTEDLKKRIQEQNLKNMTFSPRINRKKIERNKQNVHERLYKLKDKQKNANVFVQYNPHIPKITSKGESMVRAIPVDELLYMDALRRAEKTQQPEKQKTQGFKNHLQEKYAAQKLLKDFKSALDATELREKTIYSEEQLALILKEMGYVGFFKQQTTITEAQHQLLQDLFVYLEEPGVTQINLYVFLLALGGIYNVDLNSNELNSIIVIDQGQGRKLHQYFDSLYRNRLYLDTVKKSQKSTGVEQSQHKPLTNRGTDQMASKHRLRMAEKTNSIFQENNVEFRVPWDGLAHGEMLAVHNMGKNIQKERAKKQKDSERDPECTFQPNSDKYPQQLISSRIGKDKCKQLYQEARIRQEEVSRLPTFRLESSRGPLTPRTQAVSVSPSNSQVKAKIKSYLDIKDVDKTVSRMVVGRQQRNQKRQFEERGEKVLRKEAEYPLRQRQLLLDADILVNQKRRKIYIYKEDENRIDEVVDAFCRQCELDERNREMLTDQLRRAVSNLQYPSNPRNQNK